MKTKTKKHSHWFFAVHYVIIVVVAAIFEMTFTKAKKEKNIQKVFEKKIYKNNAKHFFINFVAATWDMVM